MHRKLLSFLPLFFLALIPFFWLSPGQVDLGGDSSRLYLYDPIHYLYSYPLYTFAPSGAGSELTAYYLIPYILFLAIIKAIVGSPYLLITLLNSFTLVVAFISIRGITKIFLKPYKTEENELAINLAGTIAGFFYSLSPILSNVGWDKAIVTHSQFFLNPLLFFLVLGYITTRKKIYVLAALVFSFIFAPNFFPSPYFFSFYPFAALFMFIFAKIRGIKIPGKEIAIFITLLFTIHIFHIIPYYFNTFQEGSSQYKTAFTDAGKFDRGLNSFVVNVMSIKLSNNILGIFQGIPRKASLIWLIFPLTILIGLVFRDKTKNYKNDPNFLLVLFFLLMTLYFATAVITTTGFELFKFMFTVPGFSMFRYNYGQFAHTLVFYYALVVGYGFFYVLQFIQSKQYKTIASVFVIFIIVACSWSFIKGDMINRVLNKPYKPEVKVPIQMDPVYDKVLESIRNEPLDAKYLLFPLDDYGYQILSGKNGGAYEGPSSIAYLGEKNQYSGVDGEFGEILTRLVVNKDYKALNNLIALHDIKYIFHNSDPLIYDTTFVDYPNFYVRKFLPLSQELYKDFVGLFTDSKKSEFGSLYTTYEVKKDYYLPHIFASKEVYKSSVQSPYTFIMPLSVAGDKRAAIFYAEDIKDNKNISTDATFLEAIKQPTFEKVLSENKDALFAATSITADLYRVIYPMTSLPRVIADDKANNDYRNFFDKSIFAAEKIINSFEENSITEEDWIKNLTAYEKDMTDLEKQVKNNKNSLYTPAMNIGKLRGILLAHEKRVYQAISNTSLSQDVKNSLTTRTSSLFTQLLEGIRGTTLSYTANYTLSVSESGAYTMLFEGQKIPSNFKNFQATINGKPIPRTIAFDKEWVDLGQYEATGSTTMQFSTTLPYDLDTSSKAFENVFENKDVKYLANLKGSEVVLSYIKNTVINFADWRANATYLISFDYKLYQSANAWKRYEMIVETTDDPNIANILILGDATNQTQIPDAINSYPVDVDVQNLSVVDVPYPKLILKKVDKVVETATPKITFSKINPTKYEITVHGGDDPYTLVFMDQFGKNWRLFLKDKIKEPTQTVASYFDGEVVEGKHTNTFLNADTFETWNKKPLAENRHAIANGYANAWQITPDDVQGQKDYTLVLELTSQRMIYPLLFISVCGFGIVIIWLLYEIKSLTKKIH